jgi:thiamine biosynthesis lipoprotein
LPRRSASVARRCWACRALVAAHLTVAVSLCATSLAGAAESGHRSRVVSDGRYAMGTVLELTLVTSHEAAGRAWIDAAFQRVAELERLFSNYDETSELSRLNASAGSGMQPVDERLMELLALSLRYSKLTGGSFDVSVAPLVELWMAAAGRQQRPSGEDLARTRALVGAGMLQLGGSGQAGLAAPGAAIDLGGIAKGYALDRLTADLREGGFKDALLSFGQSSVQARGAPPDAIGWRLLLRSATGGFAGFVTLRDVAFSVSSSLGQWTMIDGRRYGHVIDPRSGQPITRGLEAAVIAPTAALAEALSTALVVLGPSEGIALVETLAETEAMLVDDSGAVAASSGWLSASRFESFEESGGAGRAGASDWSSPDH